MKSSFPFVSDGPTATDTYFFGPVGLRGPGDYSGAVAHERGVVHESAPRRLLVGRHLDHVQADVAQRAHVILVLPPRPVVVQRRQPVGQRPRQTAHDRMRVTGGRHFEPGRTPAADRQLDGRRENRPCSAARGGPVRLAATV